MAESACKWTAVNRFPVMTAVTSFHRFSLRGFEVTRKARVEVLAGGSVIGVSDWIAVPPGNKHRGEPLDIPIPTAVSIELTDEERAMLESWTRLVVRSARRPFSPVSQPCHRQSIPLISASSPGAAPRLQSRRAKTVDPRSVVAARAEDRSSGPTLVLVSPSREEQPAVRAGSGAHARAHRDYLARVERQGSGPDR
jgi:hypothetical protein